MPQLYIGAFGKHPGWDDHIDDQGLETERLVSVKQVLYREGIAANIDSGAWEKLDESQRLEGFAHEFAWWIGGDLVVGRVWSSRDGKGRTKYPMVLCAQCSGVGLSWPLRVVLARLARAEEQCKAAGTAAEAIGVIDSLRNELRGLAERSAAPTTIEPGMVAALADGLNAVEPVAFGRSMYSIERECGVFLADTSSGDSWTDRFATLASTGSVSAAAGVGGGARSDGRSSPALRLPVPPAGSAGNGADAGACLGQWLAVLLLRLDPTAPVLLVKPTGSPWVDALVGEPGAAQVFVLRAGDKLMPKVSDVPYTLDEGFVERTRRWIGECRGRGPTAVQMPKRRLFGGGGGRLRAFAPVGLALAAGWGALGQADRSAAVAPTDNPSDTVPSRLDSREQYDQLLTQLKAAVERPGVTEEQARDAAKSFLDQATQLPGGIVYLREADEFLGRLRRVIEPAAADASSPRGDVTRAGPGTVPGVRPTVMPDGRARFVFSAKSGQRDGEEFALEFAQVAPNGPLADSWIGTTEVSARMFERIVSSLGTWGEAGKVMHTFGPDEDERLGPRVWRWEFGRRAGSTERVVTGIAAGAQWLVRSEGPGASSVYAPGVNVGAPNLEMPMQHLSPEGAVYAASLVGCRLPSEAEWHAARETYAKGTDPSRENLRDKTWGRQQQYVEGLKAAGRRAWNADAGSFVSPEAGGAAKEKGPLSREISDSDDGVLWFSPVGVGGGPDGAVVRHLVGNVAEWVFEGPDVGQGRDAASIAKAVEEQSQNLGVIGGSALCNPTLRTLVKQPVVLAEAREGYADVGFRLAFRSADPNADGTMAERISSLLTPLPTISPKP